MSHGEAWTESRFVIRFSFKVHEPRKIKSVRENEHIVCLLGTVSNRIFGAGAKIPFMVKFNTSCKSNSEKLIHGRCTGYCTDSTL